MRGRMWFMTDPRSHGGHHRQRARRGMVRGAILHLLQERPMHGYELITELEQPTGGRWKPSPGSIYPTLSALEDEGLVTGTEEDGKKRSELTDAGRAWLADRGGDRAERGYGGPPWGRQGGFGGGFGGDF